jgi:hypothetical protein
MSEVLRLEYEASGPSIRVTVDEKNLVTSAKGETTNVTIVGGPGHPPAHFTFEELAAVDRKLVADLVSVLARLEPIARAQGTASVENPAALVALAADLTARKQAMEAEQAAHEVAMQVRRAELAELTAALEDVKPTDTEK